MPIQAHKLFFGLFTPLNEWEAVTTEPPKDIYGCETTSFDAKIVKIGAIVAEL